MPTRSPATSSAPRPTRRHLLRWLGVGGAAAAATLVRRDDALAGHGGTNVFHLGETNTAPAGSSTALQADTQSAGFSVVNSPPDGSDSGAIRGVHGGSEFGIGVVGEGTFGVQGTGGFVGVGGNTEGGEAAVKGVGAALGEGPSPDTAFPFELRGAGVTGKSFDSIGVYGQSENPLAPGVLGESRDAIEREGQGPGFGPGVVGRSGSGPGVRGESVIGNGVEATSQRGLALAVMGTAGFSTVGSAVIPKGRVSEFVANPAVTRDSHVSVTLVSNSGRRFVAWVRRTPRSGFTVNLSEPAHRDIALTYSILEPV